MTSKIFLAVLSYLKKLKLIIKGLKGQNFMKKSSKTHYSWLFYAEGFLGLAEKGCKELIHQNYKDKRSLNDMLLYGDKYSQSRLLLIPIFYNIKHAVEIFIKGTDIGLDSKYWHSHNINYLMGNLESRVKDFVKNENKHQILEKIDKVKPIIERYFTCAFLDGLSGVEDYQNELFRYPESKNRTISKYTDYLKEPNVFTEFHKFDRKKIEHILRDIEQIHELFILIRVKLARIKLESSRAN